MFNVSVIEIPQNMSSSFLNSVFDCRIFYETISVRMA